jgi:hypothetical protein
MTHDTVCRERPSPIDFYSTRLVFHAGHSHQVYEKSILGFDNLRHGDSRIGIRQSRFLPEYGRAQQ